MNDSGAGALAPVRHVYVHAPFCARRCFYCDFAVTVRRTGGSGEWADALRRELDGLATEGIHLADEVDTLFVGGGTPSLLGPDAMADLAAVIGPSRLEAPSVEWTSEANPESLTPELAAAWWGAGLRRLSLGVQSFQEPVLRWMGRLHGAEGAEAAVWTARGAGFENLSVDLIFGLPASLERDWNADLERVLQLDLPHVSLYGLTAESGTPLGRQVEEGRVEMPREEAYEEEYLEAHRRLTQAGYIHYEVSNFCRPGFESRHNRAYWNGAPYLGLGNSSHSFLPPVRRWNIPDWAAYAGALARGERAVAESEAVVGDAAQLERCWLGLRTGDGLELSETEWVRSSVLVERWRSSGLAAAVPDTPLFHSTDSGSGPPASPPHRTPSLPPAHGRTVRLTARGWLVLDELAVELARLL